VLIACGSIQELHCRKKRHHKGSEDPAECGQQEDYRKSMPVTNVARPFRQRGARWRRILALAGLGLGFTLAFGFGHGVSAAHADTPNGITVTGSGTAELPPDQARVSGNVETGAATANDALNQNSQIMLAVIAAVKGFGFADADIKTDRVSVYPLFSSTNSSSSNQPSPPPTIVGYRATNGVTVKVRDLSKIGDLIQGMVGAGINDFNGVQYEMQNPEQLRQMALQAAISDAQAGAQTSASALGVQLGGVLNMTTQSQSAPPVPFAPAPRAVSAAVAPAPPPVMPGPLSASANVTVTYAILGR
jgi:uncharacterized protein YggE